MSKVSQGAGCKRQGYSKWV